MKAILTFLTFGLTAIAASVIPKSPSTLEDRAVSPVQKGVATFYGGNMAGACGFAGYTLPAGIYGTALSVGNWANSANCGACVNVKGPKGNTIKAMIVDECPGSCGYNHLDLFENAFTQLAPAKDGRIPITFEYVPCGIHTPLVLKVKEGVSKWWFSMQVRNSNIPIKTLEVSTDRGRTWQATQRQNYGYFNNVHGFGQDVVYVKLVSTAGTHMVIRDVKVVAGSEIKAPRNF